LIGKCCCERESLYRTSSTTFPWGHRLKR
jgi:hypothetical protein